VDHLTLELNLIVQSDFFSRIKHDVLSDLIPAQTCADEVDHIPVA
jgi:hypothetical protein